MGQGNGRREIRREQCRHRSLAITCTPEAAPQSNSGGLGESASKHMRFQSEGAWKVTV